MLLDLSHSEFAYFCLMLVAFTFLVKQAFVKQKRLVHFLFAIFCASLCMMMLQKLSASSIGIYQYVIGFAACATCNVAWLISRALFRTKNAVQKRHIFVALLIALLIVANQAWHLLNESSMGALLSSSLMQQVKQGLSETTNLLSSAILLLSFWEALRGFSSKNSAEKLQRLIFASAFFIAVFSSTFVATVFISPEEQALASPWIVLGAASLIIFAIDIILMLQTRDNKHVVDVLHCIDHASANKFHAAQQHVAQQVEVRPTVEDLTLAKGIEKLMSVDKIYLQSNIKLLDFSKSLNAPEYKVSRLIRNHFDSPNFNHFINHFRVEHAKHLLRSKDAKDWSILVIGLESGFSSLVSFNRAFKHLSGDKPSAYRTHADSDYNAL